MIEGATPHPEGKAAIWEQDGQVVFEIDEGIYPRAVVIAAAYKFTDVAFAWLQPADAPRRYLVFLKPKQTPADVVQLSGAFANELIDQALRERLNAQFIPLRTLITAEAFSEASLLDSLTAEENAR